MQYVVRHCPTLADNLHRVASPHTRHSLHRNGSRLPRPLSSADAAHVLYLHRVMNPPHSLLAQVLLPQTSRMNGCLYLPL